MSFELRTYSSWGGIFDSISMSRSSLDSKTSRHSIHSTYSASSSRETTWTRGCRHGWSMDLLCGKFGVLLAGWLRFMTFALTARALVQFPGILDRNQQLSSFSSTRNVKSRLGTHPLSSLRDLVLFANLPSAEALSYTLSPHAGLILVCLFPLRQIDTRLRPVSECPHCPNHPHSGMIEQYRLGLCSNAWVP